jgi:hypothetical protein
MRESKFTEAYDSGRDNKKSSKVGPQDRYLYGGYGVGKRRTYRLVKRNC